MFLAHVKGHVVATAKDESLKGFRLLIVEPLKVDYDFLPTSKDGSGDSPINTVLKPTGRAIVAMDQVGAGEGQLVLIVQGSSARLAEGFGKTPTDAVVVGIVDEAFVGEHRIG